jgi:hypothetical protein
MRTTLPLALAAAGFLAFSATAQAQPQALPEAPFQPVSALVDLPDFIPGMGSLYVDPATLPAGPFLAFDRDGGLVSTMYMIPLSALNAQTPFENLDAADAPVDHVDVQFNAGHPGVAEPHYHIVLWHVSVAEAAGLQ